VNKVNSIPQLFFGGPKTWCETKAVASLDAACYMTRVHHTITGFVQLMYFACIVVSSGVTYRIVQPIARLGKFKLSEEASRWEHVKTVDDEE
jgi:hypothetical protein